MGERYTFSELWVRLIKARIELMDSVEGVTQEQAEFRPDADEWSISEVLDHVITSSGRVARLGRGAVGRRGDCYGPDRSSERGDLVNDR